MPKARAIIFDMNGVIVDDETLHETAFAKILSKRGFSLSHQEYLDHFAGRTDLDGFHAFFRQQGKSFDLNELLSEKSEAYEQLAADGLSAYPGVALLIRQLRQRNILLALVTGATQPETQAVLDAFGLVNDFSVVLTASDVTDGKPSPQGYLLAAERLGLSVGDCLVIEDAPSGIEAAKRAGMFCVAVAHTHDQCVLAQADVIIEKFDEESLHILLDVIGTDR